MPLANTLASFPLSVLGRGLSLLLVFARFAHTHLVALACLCTDAAILRRRLPQGYQEAAELRLVSSYLNLPFPLLPVVPLFFSLVTQPPYRSIVLSLTERAFAPFRPPAPYCTPLPISHMHALSHGHQTILTTFFPHLLPPSHPALSSLTHTPRSTLHIPLPYTEQRPTMPLPRDFERQARRCCEALVGPVR